MSNPERISDPSLLVLISLAEGEKHGYAIMTDVEQFANAHLGPGTLYGAIQRLENRGLIQPVDTDDRRQPYRLTGAGKRHLDEQLRLFHGLARLGLKRLEAL